jgi:hypothetical protein
LKPSFQERLSEAKGKPGSAAGEAPKRSAGERPSLPQKALQSRANRLSAFFKSQKSRLLFWLLFTKVLADFIMPNEAIRVERSRKAIF